MGIIEELLGENYTTQPRRLTNLAKRPFFFIYAYVGTGLKQLQLLISVKSYTLLMLLNMFNPDFGDLLVKALDRYAKKEYRSTLTTSTYTTA